MKFLLMSLELRGQLTPYQPLDKFPVLEDIQLEEHHWSVCASLAHLGQWDGAHCGLHLSCPTLA